MWTAARGGVNMTWWMIALLAYFLPMAITVALVAEYGIRLDNVAMGVFVPVINILIMIIVAGDALNEIADARRYGE